MIILKPATKIKRVTLISLARSFKVSTLLKFELPSNHRPNTRVIDDLPFRKCLKIWFNSFKPGRLLDLQNELVELMLPSDCLDNKKFKKENNRVLIDDEGNYINELTLEIDNNSTLPTKHIVFVHGYGASLGCFARNFQLINKLDDLNYNYKIHFLDNISFGLSSNPKIKEKNGERSIDYWRIPRTPYTKLNDPFPTDPKKIYNKYYKLIESYELNTTEFENYQSQFKPILEKIEDYYLTALDKWRVNSGIDQIDYLIGHSYGGYWSASYAIKYKSNLKKLILLSPVGVERHVHAIGNTLSNHDDPKSENTVYKPSLDPTSYNFLSRWPLLSESHIKNWYSYQPFLPRFLKFLGPFGVLRYYKMWYLKLFKINKLIHKLGGAKKLFKSSNDLVYGKNSECLLIIEYLYNSITSGTNSDIYIKYLLTPSTVSKWPLYDKFTDESLSFKQSDNSLNIHFIYGQYDFMNGEAGSKLVDKLNEGDGSKKVAKLHKISESGHNLYIDNPFELNQLIHDIVKLDD